MSVDLNGICGEGLSFFYPQQVFMWVFFAVFVCYGLYQTIVLQKRTLMRLSIIAAVVAAIGMFGAQDLSTSFVCFEVTGFLSILWAADGNEEEESIKIYLIWQVITAMILTMGIFLIQYHLGTLEFTKMSELDIDGVWIYVTAACFFIGYGFRCGLFLFHSWMESILPKLKRENAHMITVLLMPGGLWGIYRMLPVFFDRSEQWNQVLLFMGTMTVFVGVIKCILEIEEKKLFGAVAMSIMGILLILIHFFGDRDVWIAFTIHTGILCLLFWFPVWNWKKGWKKPVDLSWCSLERIVYRPVFQIALPFVCGVIFRVLDQLPDAIVAWLRGSIYRDSKQRVWDKVGTPFTYVAGVILDEIVLLLNKTILYRHPIKKSFVNGMAVAKKELQATSDMVAKSVSFGLMLFCIGLCITLVYLLL